MERQITINFYCHSGAVVSVGAYDEDNNELFRRRYKGVGHESLHRLEKLMRSGARDGYHTFSSYPSFCFYYGAAE